jgi:hypothetical protein
VIFFNAGSINFPFTSVLRFIINDWFSNRVSRKLFVLTFWYFLCYFSSFRCQEGHFRLQPFFYFHNKGSSITNYARLWGWKCNPWWKKLPLRQNSPLRHSILFSSPHFYSRTKNINKLLHFTIGCDITSSITLVSLDFLGFIYSVLKLKALPALFKVEKIGGISKGEKEIKKNS